MAKHVRQLRGSLEYWVPALFALFSALWIYGSDALAAAIASSIEHQRVISTYKGFGYVFVTTVLLHLWIRAALRRERAKAAGVLEARLFNDQIIQGALEGVIVYDRELRYQTWNPFMEQLSGVPASAVLGKRALEVFPFLKDLGIIDRLQRNLAGEVFTDEIDFQVPPPGNGQIRWASNLSAPLRDAQGAIIGVLAFVRDITPRKQAEAALSEAQERQSRIFGATFDSIFRLCAIRG
jgi:PAS domain S-box-containing protein